MYIQFDYTYYGSVNCTLRFERGSSDGEIRLVTDYGETIATIENVTDLMKVMNKLKEGGYEHDYD